VNIIPESKRTESKPKLKESSVKSKHPSVSKRQSPKSSRNIVKNSPSPTKKTNIEVDKKYRDIVQNIELINKKKAEKEQLEREREKQKQKSKPKITIKEKIVHPSKRGTSSVEKSQKISENKQLFDKHFKKYINLKDINAKKSKITTLDILLSIIEVATHGQYYDVEFSNKSIRFWKKVSEIKMCENIFNSYQPETIRKYWIGLSDKQLDKVIQVVNKIKTFKDDFNVKLKSLIEFITEFLKGKVDSNFEEALIRLYDKEKKIKLFIKKKEN